LLCRLVARMIQGLTGLEADRRPRCGHGRRAGAFADDIDLDDGQHGRRPGIDDVACLPVVALPLERRLNARLVVPERLERRGNLRSRELVEPAYPSIGRVLVVAVLCVRTGPDPGLVG